MKTTSHLRIGLWFAIACLAFAACATRTVYVHEPAPATIDASAPPPASASVASDASPAPSASTPPAPSASSSVAAPAPAPASGYHAGDFRQNTPTGTLIIPSPDGGAPLRFHDGNENPCQWGCAMAYGQMMENEQRQTGTVVDRPEILHDAAACIRACPKGAAWPGSGR